MKRTLIYLAAAFAALLMAACVKEFPAPSQANLPQVSELTPDIKVDQATNVVTFAIKEKGVVPMWIFGEEKIDGKANKKYSYAGNGISLRIREAGEHSVTLKAYNANGVSQGSKTVTFTLDNTYRDPFDGSKYVAAITGTWEWNHNVDGHFGCGPVGDPLAWWPCGANGKAGFLYDDRMVFDENGNYTFKPEDGQAYANTGSGYMDEYNTGEDYLFPAPEKTWKYWFEQNWNDAGIEEIYLKFEEGAILSYVPGKGIIDDPSYLVMEPSPGKMKKKLQLMATVWTVNNPDGISWYYEFVPDGTADAGPDEPEDEVVYDITGPRNLWRTAETSLDCWYSPGDWSGGIAHQAAITENNGLTATIPEGTGGSEWMGQTKIITNIASSEAKVYDFCCTFVADQDMTVTIKLTGNPEGDGDTHAFFYDGNVQLSAGEAYTFKKPGIVQAAGCANTMLIFDFGRSPVGSTIEVKDICFQEHQEKPAVEGNEIWDNSKVTITHWYSAGDWSGQLHPEINEIAGGWSVVIPDGIGGSEWMGQTHFTLPANVYAAKKYYFKVVLNSTADCTCTVKLAWEGNDNDHAFFYDNNVVLSAYEDVVYVKADIAPDVDYDALALFVDLGRTPAGATVEIKDISLIEIVEKVDVWDNSKVTITHWYSAGDWSGQLHPEINEIAGGWSVVVPDGIGGSEWMGQTHFTMDAAVSAAKKYDFTITLNCSADCTCTVKLAWEGNDNDHAFFYDNSVVLSAYEDVVYVKADVAPDVDYDKLALFVDLGRTPAGATVEVKDIHLYEK